MLSIAGVLLKSSTDLTVDSNSIAQTEDQVKVFITDPTGPRIEAQPAPFEVDASDAGDPLLDCNVSDVTGGLSSDEKSGVFF